MRGVRVELMAEACRWGRSQEVKKEAGKGLQQRWEAQWQGFLEMLESSSRRGDKPVISEGAPWDDAKAFLASFEQVAKACHWPKEEWVTRLLPALHGEAEEDFQSLEAGDREDYGKVKAAILRGDALRMEVRRQHFRDFSCQEVEEPRRLHSQVQELCHQWLRPERHSKEQILELLILEQFLASLPPDLQGWIRAGGPDTCSQAVALVEDFLVSQEGAERAKWQGLMVAKETCPSLLKSHQDLAQPSSQTVFWQVLQEEGETIHSLDDTMGRQVKMENPQWDRNEPIDVPRTAAPGSEVNLLMRTELGEEECGLKADQSAERDKEPYEFRDHLTDTVCQPSKMSTREETPTTLKCGRRYPCKSEPDRISTGKNHNEGRMFECSHSGKGFLQRRSLVIHQKSHTGEKLNKCFQCGKCFISQENLRSHWKIHSGEKRYTCLECGKSFGRSNHLKNHQIIHTGEKPYECCQCGKCFSLGKYLKKHQRIHTASETKLYKCFQCGKSFNQEKALLVHQRIHSGEKPYECSECGKCFRSQENLRSHWKIHTGEKRYSCLECGKSFGRSNHLKTHQIIHTGEKPYECSECGKCFSQQGNLMTHWRIHTGEKPHTCLECGKSFGRSSQLKTHQIIHTGERP